MSQSEILNYDPSRHLSEEERLGFREVTFYDSNKSPIFSIYILESDLTNKSDEELARYIQRMFIAHSIDVSREVSDSLYNAGIMSNIADSLTFNLRAAIVPNLLSVYCSRILKGDGTDPEIKVVKATENAEPAEESELAALDRIIDNLYSKWDRLSAALTSEQKIIKDIWHGYLCNIFGSTLLLIWDEKGVDYKYSEEEFINYSNRIWREVYDLMLGVVCERWASQILQRLNPAGIPFLELQRIVRGGLSVTLTASIAILHKVAKELESKVTKQKNITYQISGDGRELSINLPEELKISQETIIKLLSLLSRGGPNNQKIKASDDELKAYPEKYREIQKALRTIGYFYERLVKENKDWRTGIKVEFPIMTAYPDLIEIIPIIRRDVEGMKSILESIDEKLFSIAAEKGFSGPADIAAEIAARQVFSLYQPFDVQPRWLRYNYA
jgi:hypothetical protein